MRHEVLQMETEGWWRCNMWQVAVGALATGCRASDGNVSWHVRAGPCTTPRLLSSSDKQSAQQMAENDKHDKSACNE